MKIKTSIISNITSFSWVERDCDGADLMTTRSGNVTFGCCGGKLENVKIDEHSRNWNVTESLIKKVYDCCPFCEAETKFKEAK